MIIKIDSQGNIDKGHTGGILRSNVFSVIEDTNGSLVIGGEHNSSIILDNGEEIVNHGSYDGAIVKIKSKAEENPIVIEKIGNLVQGGLWDSIYDVTQTSDGGYIAVGDFYSPQVILDNGQILENVNPVIGGGTVYSDGIIVKYNSNGEVQWADSFGGTGGDSATKVIEVSDGGYIVGGYFKGTITFKNGQTITTTAYSDGIIIKYDINGNIEWVKNYQRIRLYSIT